MTSEPDIELIPHRGFALLAPENTMAAFWLAKALGASSLELDIQISSDGVPVVIHDPTVDRTTNGTGAVKALTLAQLQALDAGSKFSADYGGAYIPTLDEVLQFARDQGLHVHAEIKGYRQQSDIDLILAAVNGRQMLDNVTFHSFNLSDVQYVRKQSATAELALIQDPTTLDSLPSVVALGGTPTLTLNYTKILAHPEWVTTVKAAGVNLAVWTVNSVEKVEQLRAIDVTTIMTDVAMGSSGSGDTVSAAGVTLTRWQRERIFAQGGEIITDDSGSHRPAAAPTDIVMSTLSVAENSANGTVVGTLSVTDVNAGESDESFTYALIDDADGRFALTGASLIVSNGAKLNFETGSSHTVTVRVRDSAGLSFSKTLTVSVADINEAPTRITAIPDQSVSEGRAWSYTVPADAFSDVDTGTTLTYSATQANGAPLPPWLSFNATTRTFSGMPPATFNGPMDLTITARDQALSISDTFRLTIAPVNDAPVALGESVSVFEDASASGTVLSNDVDPEGQALAVVTIGGANIVAQGLVLAGTYGTLRTQSNGAYSYTADRADALIQGQAVTDTFTYWVSDGSLTDSAVLAFTVIGRDEVLTGTSRANRLTGGNGADLMKGLGGNDTLKGMDGNDRLEGGLGTDTLTGGKGATSRDTFVFNTSAKSAANIDRITDFERTYDQIYLDDRYFMGLVKGTPDGMTIKKGMFVANRTGEATSDNRAQIVYENDTGKLFYDPDGKGGDGAIHFATLVTRPAIAFSDFEII
ncbi:cadherin domain-containing protein [Microvirga sp. BT689]|uniref:glycerophosphodiester phosphodiesterase family protein n=1 Tax=Microvirga arvi TaxID=2778731 RepID=UPI00194F63B5|nr:glycerophosphodiester phosphodiesterase family protein [Microvirga arvi]MBM6584133.1 cadherin domain-containing protein [Microvirga arvi]